MDEKKDVIVNLLVNLKGFTGGLSRASKDLKGFADSVGPGIDKAFRFVTRSAAVVGAGIIALGAKFTWMAAEVVESENLFEVSMGAMAKAARKWSDDLEKTLGLNAFEVRKYVGVLNTMLLSMGQTPEQALKMSEGLVQLSYDMASFYNIDVEDAFDRIRSGISGMSEPLKRMGILVDETRIKEYALAQGIIKAGQELTGQQKVAVRYQVILEATTKATGDLARTIDSPVNRLRIFRQRMESAGITIGQAFLPVLEEMTPILDQVSDSFKDLGTWLGNNKEKIRAWASEAADWLKKKIPEAIEFLKGSAKGFTETIVPDIQTAWNVLKGILNALSWLLGNVGTEADTAAEKGEKLGKTLARLVEVVLALKIALTALQIVIATTAGLGALGVGAGKSATAITWLRAACEGLYVYVGYYLITGLEGLAAAAGVSVGAVAAAGAAIAAVIPVMFYFRTEITSFLNWFGERAGFVLWALYGNCQVVWSAITGFASWAWDQMAASAEQLWKWVSGLAGRAWKAVKRVFDSVWAKIREWWAEFRAWIVKAAHDTWEEVKGWFDFDKKGSPSLNEQLISGAKRAAELLRAAGAEIGFAAHVGSIRGAVATASPGSIGSVSNTSTISVNVAGVMGEDFLQRQLIPAIRRAVDLGMLKVSR